MDVDIVLPAYNPKAGWIERIRDVVSQLQAAFAERGMQFRIVISPDGSWERTHTPEVAEALRSLSLDLAIEIKVVHYAHNRQKGFAVRTGILLSDAPYVLYTDYDFPFDLETYIAVINLLTDGTSRADVVVGRRDDEYQKLLSPFRYLLSSGSHIINRLLLNLPVRDTQGGVKGMNRRGREALLDGTVRSFLFDTEFIARATRLGLTIEAVPSKIRSGIKLSSMGWRVLLRESAQLPRIFYTRWFSPKR